MTYVSVTPRPPYLCPSEGHQHGVSIQSSINSGETFLRLDNSRMKKCTDLNLGEVVTISVIYHIPDS